MKTPPAVLYHYTCRHSATRIRKAGKLVPAHYLVDPKLALPATGRFVWLTDLAPPAPRNALGLTSHTLNCDRTECVFIVRNEPPIQWWMVARRRYSNLIPIEAAEGVMPMHWYVTLEPVEIVRLP